jgi:DNA-binding response OmpR family regulator
MSSSLGMKLAILVPSYKRATHRPKQQLKTTMSSRILVIDDDPSVRSSLQQLLEETGYTVTLAADGAEGVLELEQRDFDLVILDMNLPQITGWDILDLIIKRKSSQAVLVLTAFMDECVPGSLSGVDGVLEKPPEVTLLLNTVEFLLREPAAARLRRRTAGLTASRILPLATDVQSLPTRAQCIGNPATLNRVER